METSPWLGPGLAQAFWFSSSIHLLLLDTHLSGRGNYTRTMDKKTIIIATIKSQVALYDQLLFSPRAFCVLLLRLFSVPTKCKACLHDHLLLHGQLFDSSLAHSSINIIIWSILSLSATTTSMNPHWQISSRPRHDGNMKNTSRLWGAHEGKIQAILAHYDNIIPTIISVLWNLLFSPGIQMIIQQYVRLFQNLILLLAT